jgi:EmrB/QacA subfamily drug resistance transporter
MAATAAPAPDAPAPLAPRQLFVVFSGLLLAMLLAALDSTIVATALPTIVGELGGLEHLAWVVTAYLLAQTVVTPLYGKLGDLYGRKIVLQSAIVLFLLGSALCGLATGMMGLIVFRAVQGLGGGGLVVTTQAVVGDIVTPRERGRYQGIFGAVYGVASVAGPLLGGYFTTHISWRWIFYINLPLGILALVVLAATLPARRERVKHRIDYLGASLLAVSLTALILFTDLGGAAYPWGSPPIVTLGVVAVVGLIGFLLAERRAAEPILPLRLFRGRTFSVTAGVGLIVGFALFGSVTYLPLFLQVVNGASPTGSGLQMLPMMGGMLFTSIVSGQLISNWGRYKIFPIVGMAVLCVGLYLLSLMNAGTSILTASLFMLVLGLGLGMVMQVLVIAVQNAVDYGDLGVATSGATLFRLIGGSLGTAVFGAIFAARLTHNLERFLPPGAAAGQGTGMNPAAIAHLAPPIRLGFLNAFTASLSTVFFTAMAIAAVGFLLTLFVPEQPLRETVGARAAEAGADAAGAFAMPRDADSTEELMRGLAVLANRDVQRGYIDAIVTRAGLDLSPLAAWALLHLDEHSFDELDHAGRSLRIAPESVAGAVAELRERGLLSDDGSGPPDITDAGCDAVERLVAARRERLQEIFEGWSPEMRAQLESVVGKLTRDLVPDPRHHVA